MGLSKLVEVKGGMGGGERDVEWGGGFWEREGGRRNRFQIYNFQHNNNGIHISNQHAVLHRVNDLEQDH